jgi:hypothetical protein
MISRGADHRTAGRCTAATATSAATYQHERRHRDEHARPRVRQPVEALREARRFTARSEEFLDSLLERAGRFDVVHLSPKQKRWLEDLALKAKGASG